MVLGVLAIVWIVVLGSYARERMADRRTDSVSAFRSQISTLQRTQPGSRGGPLGASTYRSGRPGPTMPCEVARQRRKNVLVALLSIALSTVALALLVPGLLTIGLASVSVTAFTGYVFLLVERQRLITEQQAKVRPISTASTARSRPVLQEAPVRHSAMTVSTRR